MRAFVAGGVVIDQPAKEALLANLLRAGPKAEIAGPGLGRIFKPGSGRAADRKDVGQLVEPFGAVHERIGGGRAVLGEAVLLGLVGKQQGSTGRVYGGKRAALAGFE